MKTNNKTGRALCIVMFGYFLVKCVLNTILGGGPDIGELIKAIVFGVFMFTGLEYVNYVIAGLLALTALMHLPTNIMNLTSEFRYIIYLLEGLADIACAALLCALPPVREHFTNKWTELNELIKK